MNIYKICWLVILAFIFYSCPIRFLDGPGIETARTCCGRPVCLCTHEASEPCDFHIRRIDVAGACCSLEKSEQTGIVDQKTLPVQDTKSLGLHPAPCNGLPQEAHAQDVHAKEFVFHSNQDWIGLEGQGLCEQYGSLFISYISNTIERPPQHLPSFFVI